MASGLPVRQVGCQQSNHSNFVRRGLASFIAFMLIYGNSAMARSGTPFLLRGRRGGAGFRSQKRIARSARGFFRIWHQEISNPPAGSIRRPNLIPNISCIFAACPTPRDFSLLSGNRATLGTERAGEAQACCRSGALRPGRRPRGSRRCRRSPFGDPLHDRREAKQAVDHINSRGRPATPSRSLAATYSSSVGTRVPRGRAGRPRNSASPARPSRGRRNRRAWVAGCR